MRPTRAKNTHTLPKINQKTAKPLNNNNIKPKFQSHRTPKVNSGNIQLPNNSFKIRSIPPKKITSNNIKNQTILNKNDKTLKVPCKNSEFSTKTQQERKIESNQLFNSSSKNSTSTCSEERLPEKEVYTFPKISWDDFKGQPLENSWFLAVIYWYINYDIIIKEAHPKFKVVVSAKCFMNKNKSWVKHQEYEELLEHEQGHYNIGCLCALMFEKRVKRTQFLKETYKEEIKKIFSDTMREYCDLEKLYDHETYHMLNEEKQREWNQNLFNQLQNIYSC